MRSTYSPCLPTSGKVVPATSHWLHEVKYDSYRLIVQRDGSRVRLFSRNGHDWSARYPWIVESALKKPAGEAVILGVDGIADFDALHAGVCEFTHAFFWLVGLAVFLLAWSIGWLCAGFTRD
jgi:bifunctional non-homologous end joining protein LigD